VRHALARRPFEQGERLAQPVQIDPQPLHVCDALPGRGRFRDGDRDRIDTGDAGGLEGVEAADAAAARAVVDRLGQELFSNPLIESFEVEPR